MSAVSDVKDNRGQSRSFLAGLVGFMLVPTLALGVLLVAAVIGLIYFENSHQDRIYPGVSIWGVDLGGMTREDAKQALQAAFPYPTQQAFTFRDPGTGRTWSATPAQLGLTFDLDATVAAAFQLGRGDTLGNNLQEQLALFQDGKHLPPVLVNNNNAALAFLEQIAVEIYQPVVDAGLVFAEDQLIATPSQIGRQMNLADALSRLVTPLGSLDGAAIDLLIDETQPGVTDEAVAGVLAEAEMITGRPITVFLAESAFESDPDPRTLTREDLANLMVLWLDESVSPPSYNVRLDEEALAAWMAPMAELVQTEPQDARFMFNDDTGLLEPILSSVPARTLDIPATVAQIVAQAGTDNREVPLAIEWIKPPINEDVTGADLGITELVAVGQTVFTGSSEVRVHNVATAAERFHGLVIAPGATFSFNQYLGDVSTETGFEEGLIIFGGRTIKGVGGGVCQVSTTAFQAAFYAGFPILERYPHGYRVGYYEHGEGPGMDATVFYPEVDFRFVNDTPYHLLIETYTYKDSQKLTFKFYSTGDGRTVEKVNTTIANVVPHPPDLYEEDPELAVGEIKQVDWSADGADVLIERLVRAADGSVLREDRFFSHYLPWQAVFHYGPGTEGMPPEPTPEPGEPTAEPTPTPTP